MASYIGFSVSKTVLVGQESKKFNFSQLLAGSSQRSRPAFKSEMPLLIYNIRWGIATMGIKVGLKSKGEEEDWSRGLVCIRTEEYELSILPSLLPFFSRPI